MKARYQPSSLLQQKENLEMSDQFNTVLQPKTSKETIFCNNSLLKALSDAGNLGEVNAHLI